MSTEAIRQSATADRIGVLDVLRGIALLGMLLVHFNDMTGSATGAAAGVVHRIAELFLDGRFHAMFGILFGVGFAIQLRRAEARGDRFVPRYLRRLAALAVFGLIAEVVFGYNVLLSYAIWGLPLLLVRRWSTAALVVLLVVSAASMSLFAIGRTSYRLATIGEAATREEMRASAASDAAFRQRFDRETDSKEWSTVIAARARNVPFFYTRPFSFLPGNNFALFLIGLIALRLGVFERPAQRRRLIVGAIAFGLASWVITTWALPLIGTPRPPASDAPLLASVLRNQLLLGFRVLRDAWLVFAYIGVVLLLVARDPAWLRRLAPFAWTGRMALTNYMVQVAILDLVRSFYALGLSVGPLAAPVCALTLFAAQAIVSRWWLARHRFGPLEWLWRSVTNWQIAPLRIAASSTAMPLSS